MHTLRLVLRYDGTGLAGWQRQRGVRTVQQELERAAGEMAGHEVRVHGAGRTDAGVHALCQVAAFKTERELPLHGWRLGLTSKLPPEISVLDVRRARDDFDPRRASGGKRYRYLLLTAQMRDPLLRDRAWHLHHKVALEPLREAALHLLGWHDFSAFRAADCERTSTRRCLWRVAVVEGYAGVPELVALEVEGTAFLKNMVRIIVGTLVDVGRGRLRPEAIRELLHSGDRTRAGMTAPAHGLYLAQVYLRPEFRDADDLLPCRPPEAERWLEAADIAAREAPDDAEAEG